MTARLMALLIVTLLTLSAFVSLTASAEELDIDEGGTKIIEIFDGTTVTAEYLDEALDDTDSYTIAATSGQLLTIDLTGPEAADYDLYLFHDDPLDAEEIEQLTSAESFGAQETLVYFVEQTETLYLVVFAYTGNGTYDMAVSLAVFGGSDTTEGSPGTLALDTEVSETMDSVADDFDYYSISLSADSLVEVTLAGPEDADFDIAVEDQWGLSVASSAAFETSFEQVLFRANYTGTYSLVVWAYDGGGYYTLAASAVTSAAGDAANDPAMAAMVDLTSPVVLSEGIDETLDVDDYFLVTIPTGLALTVDLVGPAEADLDLFVFDPLSGEAVAASTDATSTESLVFPPAVPGDYLVNVWAYSGGGDYTLSMALVESTADDSRDTESAVELVAGTPVTGSVDSLTDTEDYFYYTPAASERISIDLQGDEGDLDLYLVDIDAVFLEGSEDTGPVESIAEATLTGGETYYVLVYAYEGKGDYTLWLNSSDPNTPPVVAFTAPVDGVEAVGMLNVAGTVTDADGAADIDSVLLQLDDSSWLDIGSESPWTTAIPTGTLDPGTHVLRARAEDGIDTSEVVSITFLVPEPIAEVGEDGDDFASAVPLGVGTNPGSGSFDSDPDDFYSIVLEANQKVTFEISSADAGTDFDLFLFDPGNRLWSFSEAEDELDSITREITVPGTYHLNVFTYSGSGAYDLDLIIEELPPQPVASFSHSPEDPVAGTEVSFDASGSTDPVGTMTYSWDFGDGSTGDGETVTHTYAAAGTFFVKLTVDTGAATSGLTRVVTTSASGGAGPTDAWTFLVWGGGDNDLEGALVEDLEEMEQVGSTDEVNVVIQMDRVPGFDSSAGDWTTTRRYYVEDHPGAGIGSTLIEDLGEVNTGDGAALTEFIEWGVATYPAQRYALIIWDHGGGVAGVSWDDTSGGDNLRIDEIGRALKRADVPQLDLIGFDACHMATLEVAYEIREEAHYMVASEEYEQGDGWEYELLLDDLVANPSWTGRELAIATVDRYEQSTSRWNDQTQSAYDLSKVDLLASRTDSLAKAMLDLMGTQTGIKAMLDAHADSELYYEETHVSLLRFAELVQEEYRAREGDLYLTALENLRTTHDETVIANSAGRTRSHTSGILVLMPSQDNPYLTRYPGSFDFKSDTDWDKLISEFQDVRIGRSRAGASAAPATAEIGGEIVLASEPGAGDTVSVNLRLTNGGSLPASSITISVVETRGVVKADPIEVYSDSITTIESRGLSEATFSWTPGVVGDLGLKLQVEYDDGAGESKTLTATRAVYVAPTGADLRGEVEEFEPVTGEDGSVSVPISVANTGGGFAKLVTVQLVDRVAETGTEVIVGSALLLDFQPGTTRSTSFPWVPVTGDHTLSVVVSSKADDYPGNNHWEVELTDVRGSTGSTGVDSDSDGHPDDEDAFPDDAAAWKDTDDDGKPDSINGFSATGLVEDDDDDGDGFTDNEEIEAGSDPLVAGSTPDDPDGTDDPEEDGGFCATALLVPLALLGMLGVVWSRRRRS